MTDTPRNDPNTPEETENKNDFQFPEVSFEDIPSTPSASEEAGSTESRPAGSSSTESCPTENCPIEDSSAQQDSVQEEHVECEPPVQHHDVEPENEPEESEIWEQSSSEETSLEETSSETPFTNQTPMEDIYSGRQESFSAASRPESSYQSENPSQTESPTQPQETPAASATPTQSEMPHQPDNGQPPYGVGPDSSAPYDQPSQGTTYHGQPPFSQTGWNPGSQPSYQPGYQPGSQPGSQPGYQPGSQPGWQSEPSQGFPPYNGGQHPPTYSPMGGAWENPPVPQKQKAGRQQKVYLILIAALAIVLTVGFVGYGIYASLYGDPGITKPPIEVPSSSEPEASGSGDPDGDTSSSPSLTIPEEGGTIKIMDIPDTEPLSATEVYERVSPSVVGVVSKSKDAEGNTGTDEGSGIIATSNGYIITNSHVVNNSRSTEVTVVTQSGDEYPGKVVGYDRTTDLAVIKIDAEGLPPAEFGDTDQMKVGNQVYAIGNPGGLEFASSMTQGIISALNRQLGSNSENGMTYIQTDAAINPGNSGGALVNSYGQVIGINSSKLVAEDFEGMGFAIPVSRAEKILNSLMNVGYVEGRVRLGITGRDLTEEESKFYEVPMGFMILEIGEDSNVGAAGGKAYDIICAVEGQEVTSLSEISTILLDYEPGDEITMTLYRRPEGTETEGKYFDITFTLLEDKGETQSLN